MNWGIVCGQTPVLDLASDVLECLATKGYKERNLIRLQKVWNHFGYVFQWALDIFYPRPISR